MHRVSTLWKANAIAFISSFCVMVIELIAARILAPYIGVSLYTWTSVIGVILGGIALGNYLGGRIADKYPSPLLLSATFLIGGLVTIAILPATKMVVSANWFDNLPIMWNFVAKVFFIFFLPAAILSMVSPLVIKLTLANLKQTGGIVGTIYACSTAGSILGTFLTGFFFILWFGTKMIVWLVAAALLLTGILVWFAWRIPNRWKLSLRNFLTWATILGIVATSVFLFQRREGLYAQDQRFGEQIENTYTKESNYFTIRVLEGGSTKALLLDTLLQSFIFPRNPTVFLYSYLDTFAIIVGYENRDNLTPRVLHLGGGGYSFPRYMEAAFPGSINDVVEIDPVVTQIAYEKLALPRDTSIKTYNQDARLFLLQRKAGAVYDVVIGDVFNDRSTPYHLTTLEFNRLVKASLKEDGIYLVNIIDTFGTGRYMPAFVHTLQQTFQYVYLFGSLEGEKDDYGTFVLAATDQRIDLADYKNFVMQSAKPPGYLPEEESKLDKYLAERTPILLTDDYVPTDILVAPIQRELLVPVKQPLIPD